MDSDCNTDSLRSLASHWTLAGDDNLLNILQNTHKKIVTKCKEVNAKLDEMVSALDDANINLQNVNNKFMALSNSQFIESRVYDDDEAVEEVTPDKEISTQPQPSQSEMVKKSLSILESMHEVVTILRDSDTESDTDEEDIPRLVLKPKDLYRERPLPYIIGTEAWKNKWHAGLVVEDSDTDSCTSKPEGHTPEYSESEEEELMPSHKSDVAVYEKEREDREGTSPDTEMTPSDMAAELARRLAAQATQIPEPEEEYSPPRPAVKTVYKPQQPTTGVIFSDEPPPLEAYDSDSGQEDIFAELHTSQPYSKNDGLGKSVADDLFGVTSERSDEGIFNSRPNKAPAQGDAVPESSSGTNERNPRFEERSSSNEVIVDKGSKKPVGGISVFGTSKGADSIGAAILRRNIRKQSTSGDESDSNEQPPPRAKNTDQIDSVKKEKDILNDLFTKPKNDSKKSKGSIQHSVTERLKENKIIEEKVKEKVDLFSDDIFDDIDDIFSSNIVKMPKPDNKGNNRSIFDDDIDLFADAAPLKVANITMSSAKGGLFDSDDDGLFGDTSPKTVKESGKTESQNNVLVNSVNFVDIRKSENKTGDLFNASSSHIENAIPSNSTTKSKDINETIIKSTKIIKESKSIFDSDSDSDIFSTISTSKLKMSESTKVTEPVKLIVNTTTSNTSTRININVDENTPKIDHKPHDTVTENVLKIGVDAKVFKSPSLFDEEDDDLFTTDHGNNNTTDDIKKIEKTEEYSKINNDAVSSNEEASSSKNLSQDTPKDVFRSPDNIYDEFSEEKPNEFEGETVLNTNNTTAVIFDKETVEKEHVTSVIEQTNIKSTNTGNEKEVLSSKECNTIPNKDILSDILSEPPVFEKPKEPKKSKNVNALFDDDSDDENLFFRRSDVTDEVPDDFSSNINQDALFGIFHDEPPAIDIDFAVTDTILAETKPDPDTDLYSPHKILDIDRNSINKPVFSTTNIPETPSSVLTKSDNLNEHKNIFSSIDSESIFTPVKQLESSAGRHNTDEENDFDELFDTTKRKLGSLEKISEIKNDDLFSTSTQDIRSVDKDLFLVTNDKLKDTVQEKIPKDTKSIKNPEPDDIFKSLAIPPTLNDKRPPVIPNFDNPDEELFKPSTSTAHPKSTITSPQISSDLLASSEDYEPKINKNEENRLDVSKARNDNLLSNDVDHDKNLEYIFGDSKSEQTNAKPNTVIENKVETGENADIKKIGKLKNMSFNIDVATLLPGAAPKKQNKLQTVSKQSDEEINVEKEVNITNKSNPTMIKSISFEGEPNSDVLDNKLSKERAKIQVKRRPSTRKARKEAVRKSVIDIEDTTDNSNSIDDLPKNTKDLKDKSISPEIFDKRDKVENIEVPQTSEKPKDFHKQEEPKVTKIVYILNDDDIFDNKPQTSDQNIDDRLKNVDNTLEDKREILDFTDGIKTIGKVYENIRTDKPETAKVKKNEENERRATKSSLFEDPIDDEELFNKNKKTIKKPSLFDSDSDEDLFAGKRKEVEKKIEVKSSLFSDDDEDDQLFAVKNKNSGTNANFLRAHVSRETKSTEPVFDDPLSMREDDD